MVDRSVTSMSEHICSRRLFLVGAAATATGALLAACGADTTTTATSSSEAASPTETAESVTGSSIPAQELTVADADVPVGGAIAVGGYILAQPVEGEFKAYSSVCPHQGREVSEISGLEATCPAHNSVFDLTDGSPISGPAMTPLVESPTTVADGSVTIDA